MSSVARWLIAAIAALAPPLYRRVLEGDLIEVFASRGTRREGWLALLTEIARGLPSLLRWRLRGEIMPETDAVTQDPFRLDRLTPRATAKRTLGLFRSFYLRALAVFLLVHFPLRIVGHLVRSDAGIGAALAGPERVFFANAVLLVSWTLVEGAMLTMLVAKRRGGTIGLLGALAESVRRFPAFLMARTLFLLAVAAGTLVLVVPGVVIACLLMLHGWLIFDRDLGALASLKESANLVRSRLKNAVGVSLPVAGITFLWVAIGVAFVAVTLRLTAPFMPIFKIAPLTMTLMETGFVLFTILTGIVYASYAAPKERPEAQLA